MAQHTIYFLVLTTIIAFTNARIVSYRNYKIYTLQTKTIQDQLAVVKLFDSSDGYLPWNVVNPMSIVVPPNKIEEFEKYVKAANLEYNITMNDVQALIDKQKPEIGNRMLGLKFDISRYHTLDEIYWWLEGLALVHRGKVEVVTGGHTYQGRKIKGVKLSFKAGNPGVVLEGGSHPSEWLTPATTIYLLHEFLHSRDPNVRKLAESFDWYIFPSLNADGFVYTHTTDRLWRKTLSPGNNDTCFGVDLNRNWGYGWQKITNIPNNECHSFYEGKQAFTEIEAITFSRYLRSIAPKLFAYINFHNLGQHVLVPYSHTRDHLDNYDDHMSMARKASEAMLKRNGLKYGVGSVGEAISLLTGSSMDYAKGELKLELSFSYLLRDVGEFGYLMPREKIIPTGLEVMDSLIAIFDEARRLGYPKKSYN